MTPDTLRTFAKLLGELPVIASLLQFPVELFQSGVRITSLFLIYYIS